MMRFTVDARAFSDAMSKVSKVLRKSPLPILEEIAVHVENGLCTLTATDLDMGVVADEPPTEDTPMFYYPFSNVYEDERVCTGNNILPRYKKLSALKNFPRYLLGLPDNDDMFYSAHNQKGLDHKALLEHLKDKDPAYYYTDILVPNGRTLSDFILRR